MSMQATLIKPLEVIYKGKSILIPTCWELVTWKQYLAYMTSKQYLFEWGVPDEITYNYPDILTEALGFLNDPIEVKTYDIDLQRVPFGDYVQYCAYLHNYKDNIELAYLDLICIFEGVEFFSREARKVELLKEPVVDKLGLCSEIIKQVVEIETFMSEHAGRNKIPLRQSEKNARVEDLNHWSYYAVIDKLANGYVPSRQEIEKQPTFEILAKIRYDAEVNYKRYRIDQEEKLINEAKQRAKKRR